MSFPEPNYQKRSYLLPPGCKDLADALKKKSDAKAAKTIQPTYTCTVHKRQRHIAATGKTFELAASITVKELAELLDVKPFLIIVDLMQLGVFATVGQSIEFEAASKVLGLFGAIAKQKPAP